MKKLIRKKGGLTMKAGYRAAIIVAAFVLLLPLSAISATEEGSVEVGLFGGLHLFQNSQNLKDRSVLGGRIGYNFSKHFGIEGALEVVKTHVDDTSLTIGKEGQFRSPMDSVRINFYDINAVYNFTPEKKFNPFILAGIGAARYNPTISTKAMAVFNVGVGAKYWLSDNIAFRADLTDKMVTEVLQETYHNIEATIGITIALGKKAKFVPPAPEPVVVAPPAPEPVVVAAPAPAPVVVAPPAPKPPEPVVVICAEPKVEEKVIAVVAEPKIEEKVIVLALEDIHFDFNSSQLTDDAKAILKKNVQILKDNPKAHYRIAGYTSASGTDEYNQKLSERRASAVKDYLVTEGLIPADRLSAIGFGEEHPETYEIAPKDLYSPAAKSNMRVLFEISVK
ncbi:MAG: OmpA family protein [bacterium]